MHPTRMILLGGKHSKSTLLKGPAPVPIKQDILTNGITDCSKFQCLLFISFKKLKLDYKFGRKIGSTFGFPLSVLEQGTPWHLQQALQKYWEWPQTKTGLNGQLEKRAGWLHKEAILLFSVQKHPKSQRKHVQQCIVNKNNFLRGKWMHSYLSSDPFIYFYGRLSVSKKMSTCWPHICWGQDPHAEKVLGSSLLQREFLSQGQQRENFIVLI